MPRKPSFNYLRTPYGWKVELPASLSSSGKRERAFFATRDKARDYAEQLATKHKKHGASHTALKPSLAEATLQALAILEPTGASLVDAAKAYRKTWDAKHASRKLSECVTDYLLQRSDLRDATLRSYKYTLEKVLLPLHDRMMSEITVTDLDKVLANKGATARAMHLRNLKTFWRWAHSPVRGWTSMEAVNAIEAPRKSNDSDIKILKPDDVRALLAAAEAECAAAAASYAIAVFGGLRMAELSRLTWDSLDNDHIEIGKQVAKKHSRRLIPICPTLRAWLDATRGDKAGDDPVTPPDWDDISKSVRRRAGWDVVARRLEDRIAAGRLAPLAQPTRGKWPQNACRHTCASVQVAIGTPLDELTFKFGHSGGHDLLRAHYVSRLTKKAALEILSIGPGGSRISNLQVA